MAEKTEKPKSLDEFIDELVRSKPKDLNKINIEAALKGMNSTVDFTDQFIDNLMPLLRAGNREEAKTMMTNYLIVEEIVAILAKTQLGALKPKFYNPLLTSNKYKLTSFVNGEFDEMSHLLRNKPEAYLDTLRAMLRAHLPKKLSGPVAKVVPHMANIYGKKALHAAEFPPRDGTGETSIEE